MENTKPTYGFRFKRLHEQASSAVSKKAAVSIMTQLIKQQRTQTRKDIEDWKQAKKQAENPAKPNRKRLIEIYEDAAIDGHLLSQMNNRIMRVTNKKFKVIDINTGQEDEEKTKLLRKKWFKSFCWLAMEAIFYGYSLIEFKELNEKQQFHQVKLVYREHVLPNREEFLVKPTDEKGIKFTDPPYSNWHIGVGDTEDLGLLLQLSLYAIYKKNTWSSWGEFEEMFGVPMRIAKTASTDPAVKAEIQSWMEEMGSAAYGVFPDDVQIDVKESTKGDAFQVFEMKRKACNEEISKLINGQTMTSDNGSSKSQADVHERTEDEITLDDMDDLQYLVNDDLLPFLAMHGYPFTENDQFVWDQEKELKITERWNIDNGILQHFDIDPKQIEERYGVKIIGKKEKPAALEGAAANFSSGRITDVIAAYMGFPEFEAVAALHNHFAPMASAEEKALQKVFEQAAKALHGGLISEGQVYADLQQALGKHLFSAVLGAFDKNPDYDTPDNAMLAYLQQNVFAFSTAKSYTELNEMRDLLLDEKQQIKPFHKYYNDVLQVHETYNKKFLLAEYNHAIGSSQMASLWLTYEKGQDKFYLVYSTAGDSRVRPEHDKLNGICLPMDDPFWDVWLPLNGWGCRCDVMQKLMSKAKPTEQKLVRELTREVKQAPMFSNNTGKSRQVFKDNHPYFKNVRGEVDELKARENYNMPSVSSLYKKPDKFPKNPHKGTKKEDAAEWLKKQKNKEGVAVLPNVNGYQIAVKSIENSSLTHIKNLPDVLTKPDEVYARNKRLFYIKYYQDMPVTVVVDMKEDLLEFVTLQANAEPASVEKMRKGILLYR